MREMTSGMCAIFTPLWLSRKNVYVTMCLLYVHCGGNTWSPLKRAFYAVLAITTVRASKYNIIV